MSFDAGLRIEARRLLNAGYLAVVILGGAGVLGASIRELALTSVPAAWYILAGLTILSGSATLRFTNPPISFSISDTFTVAAALLYGPAAGTVLVAIDSLVISFRLKRNLGVRRLLFNGAAPALSMWVAASALFALVPISPAIVSVAPLSAMLVPLFVFAALYFVLNTGLIAVAIAFESRQSPPRIWRKHFVPLWLTYFGGTAVGALLMVLFRSRDADPVVLALAAPIPLILYATFKNTLGRIEDQVTHFAQVNRMYLATIETLAHAIDAKDQVTHGHIRRVQQHAMRLASALHVKDESQLRAIEAAALLHDMGKLAVPEHILNKPGRLTAEEFEKMKRHASIGADILSSIDFPFPVVPIVRHHHENWDGSGYPAGLKGTAIPIGARILSVADCYDALTSDRPYRRRLPRAEALRILQQRSGTMYDPKVVEAFVESNPNPEWESQPAAEADALSAITQMVQADADSDAWTFHDPRRLAALFDLAADLAAVDDPMILCERLQHTLASLTPATCCALYRYHPDRDSLCADAVAGTHADMIRGLTIPLGQRLTGWVAANRSLIINSDAALDLGNLAMRLNPTPHNCLSAALVWKNDLVGALALYTTRTEAFTSRDGTLVEMLAPRIAARVAARGNAVKIPRLVVA